MGTDYGICTDVHTHYRFIVYTFLSKAPCGIKPNTLDPLFLPCKSQPNVHRWLPVYRRGLGETWNDIFEDNLILYILYFKFQIMIFRKHMLSFVSCKYFNIHYIVYTFYTFLSKESDTYGFSGLRYCTWDKYFKKNILQTLLLVA